MFLQPDGVLINRARVSKWGITIGEATIFFVKEAMAAPVGAAATRRAVSE
jgi:hypothetical protein